MGLKPLNALLFLVVPNVFLVFFGFLLYFWCYTMFVWFSKNLRESKNKNIKKNIYKGGSETFESFVFLFSRMIALVFFCIVGFLEGLFGFLKTFGKNTKTNKPISKGGSETFKTFVFLVFPNVCLVLFSCLLYVCFSRIFVWVSKNLRENKQ